MATSLGGDASAYRAARFAAYPADNLPTMAKVELKRHARSVASAILTGGGRRLSWMTARSGNLEG